MAKNVGWGILVACLSASGVFFACGGTSEDPNDVGVADAAAESDGSIDVLDGSVDPAISDPDPTTSDDPDEAGADEEPAPLPEPDGGIGEGGTVDPCEVIQPSANATVNADTIQNCLDKKGVAYLKPGTYPISTGIKVPGGSSFLGIGAPRPLLVLQPESGDNITNFMIKLGPKTAKTPRETTLISHLRLDGNNAIGNTANAATLMFGDSEGAVVRDTEIFNKALGPTAYTPAAIYFIGTQCKKNTVTNVVVYNHYYGVIFRSTFTAATANKVSQSTIHDIRCDSMTFAGYGEAISNKIHTAGWGCNNGPIPGGGFYSLNNPNGGKIASNTQYNMCGHGIDLDRVSNFVIEKNHIYDPGYTWNGTRNYCGGNAAFLLDVSESKITSNTFENNHRPHNAGHDSNRVYASSAGALFSDLPAGSKTVISFILAHRANEPGDKATHNTVNRNAFRANCTAAEGCTGLGYFSSRGTGLNNGNWSAQTTNYYTSNSAVGSNVGSVRCGANWYAGGTNCNANSGDPCNKDDYQHTGQFHNDNCRNY